MKKVLVFIIFSVFLTGVSYAQDISISANVDRDEIALDEQLTLNIVVSGSISNVPQPEIPSLDGFTAYSSGSSRSISIINGRVTSLVSFTYILVPNDTGVYTLGPFTIEYKGQTYSAGPIDVEVVPKTSSSQQQIPSYSYPESQRESYGRRSEKKLRELFIETYVDKLAAYVNEQITLTFAFYQSVNLFENPVYNAPSTIGFWTEDMPPQKKYYKMIDGRKYLVTEIKTALFATSPGEFTIGRAQLEASVEDLERFSSRSPFDIFDRNPFSIFRRGKPVSLRTDPITMEILPLPKEGKPKDFKGDVGKFNITALVDKHDVEENQPVTLKIKIEGEGNIKTISSPRIPEEDDLRFYDSGSSENISKTNYVVQGEKLFEKVVIPKRVGRFTIGPIEYSYFDPVKEKYIEKKLELIIINATKSTEETIFTTPFIVPGLSKEEVRLLKKDISFIKTNKPNLKSKGAFLYKNKIFFLINLLPLILLMSIYIYQLHRERLRTDIGYARSRRARGVAAKRLKKAKLLMSKDKVKEFYREIYRACIEYIADRLNIPHPSITKDVLEENLKEQNISQETIENLKNLFDVCDMARFAAGRFTKNDMLKTIEEASGVITELQRLG